MTAPTDEGMDGGLEIDPAIARVLLIYREAVAEATFRACRKLRALGVPEPSVVLLGRPNNWQQSGRR